MNLNDFFFSKSFSKKEMFEALSEGYNILYYSIGYNILHILYSNCNISLYEL